jgi:hypothetical protein
MTMVGIDHQESIDCQKQSSATRFEFDVESEADRT